jgi:hypothetical protein
MVEMPYLPGLESAALGLTQCSGSDFCGLQFCVREDHVNRLAGKLSLTLLVVAGSLILAACPTRTSIERINRDPGRYVGKEVAIAGHVTNSFGALGTGVFEVDDGTGRMWVFSERYGVPGNGARVGVRGRIEQGFSFGGRNFATIMRETERRH